MNNVLISFTKQKSRPDLSSCCDVIDKNNMMRYISILYFAHDLSICDTKLELQLIFQNLQKWQFSGPGELSVISTEDGCTSKIANQNPYIHITF